MDALGLLSLISSGGNGPNVKVYTATHPSYTFRNIVTSSSYNENSDIITHDTVKNASAIFLVCRNISTAYTISDIFYTSVTETGTTQNIFLHLLVPNFSKTVTLHSWGAGGNDTGFCRLIITLTQSNEFQTKFQLSKNANVNAGSSYTAAQTSFLVIAFF